MARATQPVSIWGITFDALMEESKSMTSTIPEYPVESGFVVSDTIINDPIQVDLTLYLTNTPVTWLYRHGNSTSRVKQICSQIENKWFSKELTKIVTSDTTYTNMGITSISIRKSSDIGYAREISISARQVRITERKTADIPSYVLKSGETMANAGKTSTSKESSASTSSSTGSVSTATESSTSSSSSSSSSSKSSSSKSNAQKSASILYGAARGLNLV